MGNFYRNNYIEHESNGDKNKTLSIKEYLDEIKPYLRDVIKNLKKSDTWKIQLKIGINFISSNDTDEEQAMHSESNNIELMIYDNADEATQEIFESLLSRYQAGLEESKKRSDFVFVVLQMSYKNLKRGGLYIDSPGCIKK